MIAVDTNILVYAHRKDSSWHAPARDAVTGLAEGAIGLGHSVAVPPRVSGDRDASEDLPPPTPLAIAIDQVSAWLESPTLVRLAETESYWDALSACLAAGRVSGPQVHDARVAALCLAHGVRELWTHDRDFGRFAALVVRNPLV